jgi:acyl transferase domain-containing protein
MAGRFPGADDVAQFWDNLLGGVNSVVEIPEHELNLPADSPLRDNPNLVRKSATVKDADQFDADFFGIIPKEAEVIDPQHRLMLETCWHAMEDAGYCPDQIDAPVGVFAGCYMNTYILAHLASNAEFLASLSDSFHFGDLRVELGSDKDHLATRVSYLLDLRGPSITVQTSCSTSLVAIIQACQALQARQCKMALAGGCMLDFPQQRGYLCSDGFVSPDGCCRTFDASAQGTVFGEGVGAVLLKRADDAIADGDDIYGIIQGWGINNDGRTKNAYTAPSVEGQSAAVALALQSAGITADTVTYVEAHGTGTLVGDPVEIEALTKAFRETTEKKQFCAIGAVKSNIGHLDVAAGVAGLIKICLAVRHGVIPPTLHFERANPDIDFENSPFYVVCQQQQWDTGSSPRRAGLSSFGMGGTNAHVVVQQPPALKPSQSNPSQHALLLSAKNPSALDQITAALANRLDNAPDLQLADVAYTLQTGRNRFDHTRVLVANSIQAAKDLLLTPENASVFTQHQLECEATVAFMFPGQGSQHVNMARHLYDADNEFRAPFDECCEILRPILGFDLKQKIFVPDNKRTAAELNQTGVAQPAIFAVSYSLAKRLERVGIVPEAMIGHSVGEFVAACLAGVFSLTDALRLIAFRAQRMQQLPSGSMMAIRMSEAELAPLLDNGLEIAAINGPSLCVVAGPHLSIELLQEALELKDVVCRPLHTSHAFHSAMMDPVVTRFAELLNNVQLSEPIIPIISSVSGQVLSAEQATDPMYWARHLRETVRFTDSLQHLLVHCDSVLLEVGPGQSLGTLARQHTACPKDRVILSTCAHAGRRADAAGHFMLTLARLWQAGVPVRWSALYQGQRRVRLHLPTHPFQRKRYWFDTSHSEPATSGTPAKQPAVAAAQQGNQRPESVAGQLCGTGLAPTITEQVIAQQLDIMKKQLDVWNQ